MKSVDQWLDEYGQSHQNPTNKTIHWICVPLITFSLLGMLWDIPFPLLFSGFPYLNLATIFMLIALLFYIRLSLVLSLGMAILSVAMVFGLLQIQALGILPLWQISLLIFVLAWIGQFIGHKVEGKKPSFFKDVQFLLIGPIWLLSFVFKKINLKY